MNKFKQIIAGVAALFVLLFFLFIFWPRTYFMVFDIKYLPIGRSQELGESRTYGCSVLGKSELRCWAGRNLFDGSLNLLEKLPKPKVVRVTNEAKGWFIELADSFPSFDWEKNLVLVRMSNKGLTVHDPKLNLDEHLFRWPISKLGTEDPPVALLWHSNSELIAVFPRSVQRLTTDGRAKTLLTHKEQFNWSAALSYPNLVLGRAGTILLYGIDDKKKREIKMPAEQMAPWAQAKALAFLSPQSLIVAVADPQPERCRLHKIDPTKTKPQWGKGLALPKTKDDFAFVCQPKIAVTADSQLRLFCAQYTAGGGSAILFHLNEQDIP